MGYARTVKAAAAAAAGVLAAVILWLVGPAAADFVAAELPRAQAAAATWLTPPYLYLVINAIILSIAASSRFQVNHSSSAAAAAASSERPQIELVAAPTPAMVTEVPVPAVQAPEAVAVVEEPEAKTEEEEEEEEFLISRSTWTPRRREEAAEVVRDVEEAEVAEVVPFLDLTNSREKPLVSTRFGRKSARPSPEGGSRALRVARPRREETLESTWKAITEGRAPPLARHLKKSDTWETRASRRPSGGEEVPAPAPATATAMRKADTFNEARKVRREPSLGQDELNRRVEAFINKFNMEMRLQRQESLKHYNEMIIRDSH